MVYTISEIKNNDSIQKIVQCAKVMADNRNLEIIINYKTTTVGNCNCRFCKQTRENNIYDLTLTFYNNGKNIKQIFKNNFINYVTKFNDIKIITTKSHNSFKIGININEV